MPESQWQSRRDRIIMLTAGQIFTASQQQRPGCVRAHLIESLSVDPEDFEELPVFTRYGGWSKADRDFNGKLAQWLREVNEAVAA